MKIPILIALVFGLVGCGQQQIVKMDELDEKEIPESPGICGLYYFVMKDGKKFTGIARTYFRETDKIRREYVFVDGIRMSSIKYREYDGTKEKVVTLLKEKCQEKAEWFSKTGRVVRDRISDI